MAKQNQSAASSANELTGVKQAQTFNANTETARLGFALRDKLVTEATSIPHVIPKLGMSIQTYLSREATPMIGLTDDDKRNSPLWISTWNSASTIPGGIVLDFDHLMAVRDAISDSETNDIFTNKWEEMRILNNMTKNWQPQDLQYLWLGLMEIKAHMANIRRILNVMARVYNHQLNEYYSAKGLVSMLGFSMNEREIRQNYFGWWQFFNVALVGALNNLKWLTNMVPGENRWAGMYTEIYKDVSPYTDYTQLYLLRPRHIMMLQAAYVPNVGYSWTFEKRDYMLGDTAAANGVAAFTDYLEAIRDLIRDVFYDDSSADIIATINAITERNMGNQVTADYLHFDQLPLEGEEVHLTYDLNLLIAIHNATILPNADVQRPIQDPSTGSVSQKVLLADPLAQQSATFAKLVDLPNFGATTADMITATQWTIVSPGLRLDPTSTTAMELRANAAGTEICTRAAAWYYNWDQNNDTFALSSSNLSNLVKLSNKQFPYTIPEVRTMLNKIGKMSAFAYSPLLYIVDDHTAADTGLAASNPLVENVIGQTEVLYSAGYRTISEIHRQFVRNFWGYPIAITENRDFQTSYASNKSVAKTGSAAEKTSSQTATATVGGETVS